MIFTQRYVGILFSLFFLLSFPSQLFSATNTWSFTSGSNYTFDADKIEVSSGVAQLKATTSPDWYNTDWNYRRSISIDNTSNGSALTNYQASTTIVYDADMQSDFDDIRFADSDGATLLDHWLETKTDGVSAVFWVEVPSIPASTSDTIYIYYGNSTVSSASNGTTTFKDFDDFNRADLGTLGEWTKSSSNPLTDGSPGYGDPDVYAEGGTFYVFADNLDTGDITVLTSTDGVTFTSSSTALTKGSGGDWDSSFVRDPSVTKIGSVYYMWYAGTDGSSNTAHKIGVATSTNLTSGWTKASANPIFTRMGEGVNEPSILYEPDDTGQEFKMLFTAGLGSTDDVGVADIGYATSTDGMTWTDAGDVITGSWQDQEQIKVGDTYHMFVNDSNANIFHSFSPDHISWSLPVSNSGLTKGASYDATAVFAPGITSVGDTYYMYYQASQSGTMRIALATTSTANLTGDWTYSDSTYFDISSNQLKKQASNSSSWENLIRTNAQTVPYIFETDVEFETENTAAYEYAVYVADDASFHYAILFDPSDNEISLWRTDIPDGASSTILDTSTSVSYTTGVEYKLRAIVTASNVQIDFYDGTTWHTDVVSAAVTTKPAAGGYYGFNNTSEYVADNFRFRAYTADEPSTTIGTESTEFTTDDPAITPVSGQALTFESVSTFSASSTTNGGSLRYQLSNDSGTTWQWYSGGWTTTTAGFNEANTESDINTNIGSFSKGDGSLLFRAYFRSDGTQLVQLDDVSVAFEAPVVQSTGGGGSVSRVAKSQLKASDSEEQGILSDAHTIEVVKQQLIELVIQLILLLEQEILELRIE